MIWEVLNQTALQRAAGQAQFMNPVRFKGTVVDQSHSGAAPLRRSVLGWAVVLVPECLLQLGTVSPSGEQPGGAVTARL